MKFNLFKVAVQEQFKRMQSHELFKTSAAKDTMWKTYLESFPEGTNPIYKERTEYDCQCCKQFIRQAGNIVAIIDGKVETIWDINVGGYFQVVADALAKLVRESTIENFYLTDESSVGTDKNFQEIEGEPVKTWEHFYLKIPKQFVVPAISIDTKLGELRSNKDVFKRSLEELTVDSIETVLDLISQNSLYRGEEHKFAVESFLKAKKEYNKTKEKELFVWLNTKTVPVSVSKIRNTAIGTLLVDLSEGKELDESVKSFESKVAPTNYKRPTALVTKAMITKAQETINALGLTESLERRYANINDITVNNILFVDRDKRSSLKGNVFDEIAAKVPDSSKKLDKVEEIGIVDFIDKVLPQASSIELLVENRHSSNMVSLIAPVNTDAKKMFKWDNNFSWSYVGELTDSIKERVKQAGGKVDGDLRCSLSWFNHDDLDLHMVEPDGTHIFFGNKRPYGKQGVLDVDMNAGYGTTRTPVENICYPNRKKMQNGVYTLYVNQYCSRESDNIGFDVEIEFDGNIHSIHYPKATRASQNVVVAKIEYNNGEFKILQSLPSSQSSKTVWNVATQKFHKASVVMLSPNHWDEKAVGNKHYFFMLQDCKNEGKARGFFNEFLSADLDKHRKVLEIVGSKMKTEESDSQLSGLGFSSTQRNNVLCKVNGSFNRTVKIVF